MSRARIRGQDWHRVYSQPAAHFSDPLNTKFLSEPDCCCVPRGDKGLLQRCLPLISKLTIRGPIRRDRQVEDPALEFPASLARCNEQRELRRRTGLHVRLHDGVELALRPIKT